VTAADLIYNGLGVLALLLSLGQVRVRKTVDAKGLGHQR
jgi:hypothetical protein